MNLHAWKCANLQMTVISGHGKGDTSILKAAHKKGYMHRKEAANKEGVCTDRKQHTRRVYAQTGSSTQGGCMQIGSSTQGGCMLTESSKHGGSMHRQEAANKKGCMQTGSSTQGGYIHKQEATHTVG